MKTSEVINDLAKAMAEAQKKMKPASKDGLNPHFKSKYSNISSVWESIRLPITENGLTIWQDVITTDKSVSVTTRLVHLSGQWVEFGPLSIPLSRLDAQVIGSATSYAKRYALCAAIGVVSDDDDDGELAMNRPQNNQIKRQVQNTNAQTENKITSEQAKELAELITNCSESFQQSLWDFLSTVKINSFEEMNTKIYEKIKTRVHNELNPKEVAA